MLNFTTKIAYAIVMYCKYLGILSKKESDIYKLEISMNYTNLEIFKIKKRIEVLEEQKKYRKLLLKLILKLIIHARQPILK